jgi:hypothetical protein
VGIGCHCFWGGFRTAVGSFMVFQKLQQRLSFQVPFFFNLKIFFLVFTVSQC